DDFSVRWTGWFTFTEDTYNFAAQTDDGLRVWVDGTLIIDAWWDQPPTFYQASHDLTAGEHEVKAEYYERSGGAVAHVRWWGSTSDSDDGRVISSNETLWGKIEPSDDTDSYYFDATQEQVASIRMVKSNFTPSLDPYLILYAPDGSEVTRDDDSGGDLNVLINRVPLTQTGRYRIEAKSYAGNSNGLYSLSLTLHQPGQPNRGTYDANHRYSLPGTLVRSEGDGPTGDQDVDNAHDFAGETYDYYWNTHNRDSYDDQGATPISTANYGYSYMNAFWNGEQVVYGDGFPVKDIVAHEWTHAVTEHSAELEYRWQSGALNESFSDIFGAMVDRDDWLMGEDLPPDVLAGREAIRDLSDPPRFGQPDHTDDWVETCSDNEGVHTNNGIPNKAFYNIATAIGKDKAEQIFYRTLTVYLDTGSSLEDARAAALQSAEDLYGSGSAEYTAVQDGFNAVGLDGVWQPPPNDCDPCAARTTLSAESDGKSLLDNLRAVRDKVFNQDPGRRWTRIYYKHQFEVAWLVLSDSQLRTDVPAGFRAFDPVFRALLDSDT
ncbi:MAG: M4 family metallopeptidase, partial [Candidatus Eisenbacteria sp.]|nr:M4 family metallopeptidase [Candidatus Eisenbacteria bacterium]